MRRAGRIVAAGLTLRIASTVTGCSLGARQAMADRVIASANAAALAKTLAGTLAAQVILVPKKGPQLPGPPRILGPLKISGLVFAADLASGTTFVGDPLGAPALVFSGSQVYQRRGSVSADVQALGSAGATNLLVLASAAPQAGGIKPQGRPWLKLDFDRLPRTSQERTAGSLGVDPAKLIRLLRGALAGSLKNLGAEEVEGVSTTHYGMNVSREKASRGLPNRERIRLEKVFSANAVEGDISKGEVWIGPDGRPRRVLVTLRQRLDSTAAADLVVTINVRGYGLPITQEPPKKREVATVTTFGQLVPRGDGRLR